MSLNQQSLTKLKLWIMSGKEGKELSNGGNISFSSHAVNRGVFRNSIGGGGDII